MVGTVGTVSTVGTVGTGGMMGTVGMGGMVGDACTMVRRSETGDFGAAWLQDHGLPVGSETLGLSS